MRLSDLKGVGDATLKKLNKLGIDDVRALARFMPAEYLDLTRPVSLSGFEDGHFVYAKTRVLKVGGVARVHGLNFFKVEIQVISDTVKAQSDQADKEKSVDAGNFKREKALTDAVGRPADLDLSTATSSNRKTDFENFKVYIICFNQPYLRQNLKVGEPYFVFGKVRRNGRAFEFINPKFEKAEDAKRLKGIVPIYRTKGLVAQTTFRNLVQKALKAYDEYSLIDENLCKAQKLSALKDTVFAAHNPDSIATGYAAQQRLLLEETVNLVTFYNFFKKNNNKNRKLLYNLPFSIILDFAKSFPFTLTDSQVNAVKDIFDDLHSDGQMNRIVVGDVGSGKTAVAFLTMFYAAKCGYQCALMAPTEILAAQHFQNAQKYFENTGINTVLRTGSLTDVQKKAQNLMIESGQAQIVIGTHSIFQKGVSFKNLALTVTDEQHRFGVVQKNELEEKGEMTDNLTLSATPIPRTLSMLLYDGLQMSEIKRHTSRENVVTKIVPNTKSGEMFEFIAKHAPHGKQAFVVCPRITDSEGAEIYSAANLYEELTKSVFKNLKVGLLHGRQSAALKAETVSDFSQGKLDVLISTTVIEVGVDIKNASVIAVMNSEFFGLATLHQLRGRVGRGGQRAYCFLVTDNAENARLKALCQTDDGFELAEKDFSIRGGGDFLGTRQTGAQNSGYAVPLTKEIILKAKQLYSEITADDSYVEKLTHIDCAAYYDKLKDVTVN